jgi:hypothetical protein
MMTNILDELLSMQADYNRTGTYQQRDVDGFAVFVGRTTDGAFQVECMYEYFELATECAEHIYQRQKERSLMNKTTVTPATDAELELAKQSKSTALTMASDMLNNIYKGYNYEPHDLCMRTDAIEKAIRGDE